MLGKTNVKVKPNRKVDYVEYIESTGTQYIDTGFKPNQNTRVVIKCQLVSTSTTNHLALFGEWSSNAMFRMYYHKNNATYSVQFYNTTYSNLNIPVNNNILNVDMNKNVLKVNDTVVNTASTGSFNATVNMYLFGSNSAETGFEWTNDGRARIYSCQIYDNDVLIRNFKPCKDGAGVYCLYDEVEQRYYYNQGTGSFYGEGVSYFSASIAPTSWTQITEGLEYKATNDYGTWRIWADNCQAPALYPINLAFDNSTASIKYYQSVGNANMGIDLPEGLKICPFSIQVVHSYLGANSYVQGLSEDGNWETLTEIDKSDTTVTRTLNIATEKYYSKFRCYLNQYSTNYKWARVMDFKITSGLIKTGGDA